MSASGVENLEGLVTQAESMLRRGLPRHEISAVLERIVAVAPDGSDALQFAHRHLAELRIEEAPWVAALHLRKVMAHDRDDDVAHALMGLCQALLGNFRAAVAAYRRALALSPRNPWYHHNLGHLLDVALAEPKTALPHLRSAHRLEPLEDEITASLAHCLAGAGDLDEARTLADEAVRGAPRNKDHRALLAWIERGAPAGGGPHSGIAFEPRRRGTPATPPAPLATDAPAPAQTTAPRRRAAGRPVRDGDVLKLLERHMRDAGFSARQLEVARELFRDYLGAQPQQVRVTKPEVFAAAVEYAIARLVGKEGVTRAQIAKRYGCAAQSLGARYQHMREVLALRPRDPRYGN